MRALGNNNSQRTSLVEKKNFLITGDVVAEDSGRDDVSARGEEPLEVGLGHVLGEPRHVEVGALDGLAARAGIRDLIDGNVKTLSNY